MINTCTTAPYSGLVANAANYYCVLCEFGSPHVRIICMSLAKLYCRLPKAIVSQTIFSIVLSIAHFAFFVCALHTFFLACISSVPKKKSLFSGLEFLCVFALVPLQRNNIFQCSLRQSYYINENNFSISVFHFISCLNTRMCSRMYTMPNAIAIFI